MSPQWPIRADPILLLTNKGAPGRRASLRDEKHTHYHRLNRPDFLVSISLLVSSQAQGASPADPPNFYGVWCFPT